MPVLSRLLCCLVLVNVTPPHYVWAHLNLVSSGSRLCVSHHHLLSCLEMPLPDTGEHLGLFVQQFITPVWLMMSSCVRRGLRTSVRLGFHFSWHVGCFGRGPGTWPVLFAKSLRLVLLHGVLALGFAQSVLPAHWWQGGTELRMSV